MAVTGKLYGKFFSAVMNKEVNLLADTIKVMLTTSGYTPDQDVDDYKNDVTNEVVGTGYIATGVQIANDTFTYTAGTNLWTYDGDDVSWAAATITARTAVIYDSTPATDATRPLIAYQQSDADIISTAGTFSVVWNAAGIFTITVG